MIEATKKTVRSWSGVATAHPLPLSGDSRRARCSNRRFAARSESRTTPGKQYRLNTRSDWNTGEGGLWWRQVDNPLAHPGTRRGQVEGDLVAPRRLGEIDRLFGQARRQIADAFQGLVDRRDRDDEAQV